MHLQEDGEQLTLLAEISNSFSRSLDIDQALTNGIESIMALMEAEAASVFLYDEHKHKLVCRACAGCGEGRSGILGLELGAGQGIAGRAAQADQPILVRDVSTDPDFAAFVDAATGFTTRSIIAAPLRVSSVELGAIEVINKRDGGLFDGNDKAVLSMLAGAAALAIHNARMTATLLVQQRMQRELELAREIQAGLLPPAREHYPVRGVNLPALEVSGDFYDFFDLADGRIGFNLADVSGKGMNAALLGVKAATLLRSLGRKSQDPGTILARINDELCSDSLKGMFITAIAGVFDPVAGQVSYANAGHPPPLLVSAGHGSRLADAQAPPLGIRGGFEYPVETVSLKGGDMYLYTDGLSEAVDESGYELGVDGVLGLLVSLGELPVDRRLQALLRRQGSIRRDDVTVMILQDDGARRGNAGVGQLARLKTVARPESLHQIRQILRDALEAQGHASSLVHDLVLAVNEACMNVVQHGIEDKAQTEFFLDLIVSQGKHFLEFELSDDARPGEFDSFQGRDLGDLKPGGLGMHFIREIMDEVEYGHLPDQAGNRLTMRKRL